MPPEERGRAETPNMRKDLEEGGGTAGAGGTEGGGSNDEDAGGGGGGGNDNEDGGEAQSSFGDGGGGDGRGAGDISAIMASVMINRWCGIGKMWPWLEVFLTFHQ